MFTHRDQRLRLTIPTAPNAAINPKLTGSGTTPEALIIPCEYNSDVSQV